MKRYFLLSMLLFCSISCFGQQTINDTITHDGLNRSFVLYVPASYNAGVLSPLVFNLHGYTSTGFQQMFYGDFRLIADTAGFLLVHPDGTLDSAGQTHWNANWGGTVDDIGFIEALIDSLSLQYTINPKRVYSTGMSNGGFMSYTLACSLSNRIAAIASVTGSMVVTQIAVCNPQHPVPVMEIHGTADGTVPYGGIPGTVEPIDDVLDYWINIDQCDTTPVVTMVPDINTGDGCTAEHYLYQNGNNGVEVELYKIIGGEHTWPGSKFPIGITNQDINASVKIWEFFNKYDIDGRINTTGIQTIANNVEVHVYPNPVTDIVVIRSNDNVDGFVRLINLSGVEVGNKVFDSTNSTMLTMKNLSKGMYFLQIFDKQNSLIVSKKLIKI